MDPLPKIPVPLKWRMQRFRHNVLPFIVTSIVLACAIGVWRANFAPVPLVQPSSSAAAKARQPAPPATNSPAIVRLIKLPSPASPAAPAPQTH